MNVIIDKIILILATVMQVLEKYDYKFSLSFSNINANITNSKFLSNINF